LRYSAKRDDIATAIEKAVNSALEQNCRTGDVARGYEPVSTDQMGDKICEVLAALKE